MVESIGALNTVLIRDGRTIGPQHGRDRLPRSFEHGLPDVEPRPRRAAGRRRRRNRRRARPRRTWGCGGCSSSTRTTSVREALAASLGERPIEVELVAVTPAGSADALADERRRWSTPRPMGMAAHPGSPVPDGAAATGPVARRHRLPPARHAAADSGPRAGCTVLNGAGMAVHQAADAFELITGRPADRAAMTRDFDELVAAEATPARLSGPASGQHWRKERLMTWESRQDAGGGQRSLAACLALPMALAACGDDDDSGGGGGEAGGDGDPPARAQLHRDPAAAPLRSTGDRRRGGRRRRRGDRSRSSRPASSVPTPTGSPRWSPVTSTSTSRAPRRSVRSTSR